MKFSQTLKICTLVMFAFLSLANVAAQKTSISGVVKDATGEPIIGANVLEKGTSNGSMTDIDGNFRFSVSSDATLVVTFMGYKQQEIAVAGKTSFVITLQEDTELLEEVVVIGYGVVKKNDATGSLTSIKPNEKNRGLAATPQDILQGKVAGVNITTDGGTPGGSSTIRIRGGSSLNASNDPLIVIDGLAMDNNGIQGVANPLSVINPNDIETFTVLKDASATAIYGSRASNGVIIITTKKGKVGQKPAFTYNGNVSLSTLVKRVEVMNAQELKNYAAYLNIDKPDYLGNADTDWQNEIYQAAIGTDHSFTMAGGTKNIPYRVSFGLTYQDGIIKTSNMHRGTLSVNLNPTFFDKHLMVNVNAKAMYIGNRFADNDVVGASLTYDPTQPVRGIDRTQRNLGDDGSNYGGFYQRTNAANFGDATWKTTWNNQAVKNPVATLDLKNDRSKAHELVGNLEADYKIHGFEDLHLHVNIGADYANGVQTTEISPYSATNHYYGWHGKIDKEKYNLSFTSYAQYLKQLTEIQYFDVMAGYEYQHFMKGRGTNYGYGLFPATSSRAGEKYNNKNEPFANQLYIASLFGRINYTTFDKYLLTASLRADQSSYFSPDRRTGIFPSLALAWKMEEEDFLQNVNWLEYLKLRLGWGITGQQEINKGDAPYLAIFDPTLEHGYYTLGERNANGEYIYYSTYRPRAVNKAITWEKTTTYNLGLDYGFLRGRIAGSIDVYHRVTTDLINEVDVLAGTNFRNRVVANVGSLANTGVEFVINATPVMTKEFSWDLSFNATYNKNEITKIYTDVATGPNSSVGTDNKLQIHRKGYPASSFFVYETKQDENGNWYFVDRDGNGQINANDMYCYQKPAPDFIFGFSSTFTYKKFDLSIALRANVGNYMYNDVLAGGLRNLEKANFFATKVGGFTNIIKEAYNTYWGGFKSDNPMLNGEYHKSDYFIQNASFLRCDKITLGYNIAKPNIRVFATVQNPFVITKYKGLDPEKFDGVDNNIYPRSMASLIGLTYNF